MIKNQNQVEKKKARAPQSWGAHKNFMGRLTMETHTPQTTRHSFKKNSQIVTLLNIENYCQE